MYSFPMSIFCVLVYAGQAISPSISSALVSTGSGGWRLIFWFQGAFNLVVFIAMLLLLQETRGTVLLSRRAIQLSKETGKPHRTRADDERQTVAIMVQTSLSRPFLYLTTEPICLAFSLFVGVAWALLFLSLTSVPIAFGRAYGYTGLQSSFVLLGIAVGGLIGWALQFHQEYLYHRKAKNCGGKPPPEARLTYPCVGAILFPVGLFMYAWGTRPEVHPAVGIIGVIAFNTGVYWVYVGVFSFLSDVYERYASSALAAQSWLRNLFAGVFPLFGVKMYEQLDAPIATTILASISAALAIVPFGLYFYGDRLRKASRVARQLAKEEEEAAEFMANEREKTSRRQAKEERKRQLALQTTPSSGLGPIAKDHLHDAPPAPSTPHQPARDPEKQS